MAKKKVAKAEPTYTVFLRINGEEYTSTSDTLEAAVLNLPAITPKTTAVFTVAKDGQSARPFILNIMQFKKLFYPGMTGTVQRTQFAKRYEFFTYA